MSTESVMPSNHLTLCHPLLLLPSIFPSIRVFSNELILHIRIIPRSETENGSEMSNSLQLHGLYSPWNSPGQNTGVGSLSLLQGIFPTQGSNLGLPLCRQILYQLSHQGSPRILEWVAYPSLVDLPGPGIKPGSPACKWILYQLIYQRSPYT